MWFGMFHGTCSTMSHETLWESARLMLCAWFLFFPFFPNRQHLECVQCEKFWKVFVIEQHSCSRGWPRCLLPFGDCVTGDGLYIAACIPSCLLLWLNNGRNLVKPWEDESRVFSVIGQNCQPRWISHDSLNLKKTAMSLGWAVMFQVHRNISGAAQPGWLWHNSIINTGAVW